MNEQAVHAESANSAAKNLALMLETACEDFAILQDMIRGDLQVKSKSDDKQKGPGVTEKTIRSLRAPARIQMALAKDFVFNTVHAYRICTQGAGSLKLDREEQKRFIKAIEPLMSVRDVNEHGFDPNSKSEPSTQANEGGILDETSMMISGPDKILMGPANLATISVAVECLRKVAGFAAPREREKKKNAGSSTGARFWSL